ncbi:histidine kinase [Streptomyces sp. LP05-1]|uniref:Histidine kinase n=1 Tax=Streptomyces pyxinae TaxID=2970734 RepID=A0ABT2CN26_9ACTN|nr:histidine kinase [Streptomyces sp. LP05-1]MCS0638846.1 histidine kinase [Streptomyces sp. LP05-1]
MRRLTGWWSGRSNPEKVELYTRWSFHLFVVMEMGSALLAGGRPTLWALLVFAHALTFGWLCSRALDWALGRRERPYRLMAAYAVITGGGACAILLFHRPDGTGDTTPAVVSVVFLLAFGIAGLVLCLRRARHMLYLVLATSTAAPLVALALGLPATGALALLIGVCCAGLGLAFTSGFSAWLVKAVWQLDAARELQARLAVAEERLRFGRDLHDVLGRNLSVIALKSELAVRLARRGAQERAADEMTEVQRIARESQREVRDVVRGYREADLGTELEGARSILAAAGIACVVEAGGAGTWPAAVQSALGWVVREATTNVLRHSDARRCTVSVAVSAEDGCAVLVVENDGLTGDGGPSGAPASRGLPGPGSGLAGLRERLAALDGALAAGRLGDDRFRVTARVPVTPPGTGGGEDGNPGAGRWYGRTEVEDGRT